MITDFATKADNAFFSNNSTCAEIGEEGCRNDISLLAFRVKFISNHIDNPLHEISHLTQRRDKIYGDIIDDLILYSKSPRQINCKRVIETVLACAKIDQLIDQIAELKGELERIKFITRKCGINAEPDFCPGHDFHSIKTILENRTNALRSAYRFSRDQERLEQFFLKAFQGDPCLNGTIIALTNFQMEYELGIPPDQIRDRYTYDEFAFKCTELMYGLSDENPPNQKEFTDYLKNQKDYSEIYRKWVESNQWTAIYRRAVELFA